MKKKIAVIMIALAINTLTPASYYATEVSSDEAVGQSLAETTVQGLQENADDDVEYRYEEGDTDLSNLTDEEWENLNIDYITLTEDEEDMIWGSYAEEYNTGETIDKSAPDGCKYVTETLLLAEPKVNAGIYGRLYSGTTVKLLDEVKEGDEYAHVLVYASYPDDDETELFQKWEFYLEHKNDEVKEDTHEIGDIVEDEEDEEEIELPPYLDGYVEASVLCDEYPVHYENDLEGTEYQIKYSTLTEHLMPLGHMYTGMETVYDELDAMAYSNSGHYFDSFMTFSDCTKLHYHEYFTNSFNLQDGNFLTGYSPDSTNLVAYFTMSPWEEGEEPEDINLSFSFVDGTFYFDSDADITNDIVLKIKEMPGEKYKVSANGLTKYAQADDDGYIAIPLTSFKNVKVYDHTGGLDVDTNEPLGKDFGEKKGDAYYKYIKQRNIKILIIIAVAVILGLFSIFMIKKIKTNKPRRISRIHSPKPEQHKKLRKSK